MTQLRSLLARLTAPWREAPPVAVAIDIAPVEVARLKASAGDMVIVTMPPIEPAHAHRVRAALSDFLTSRLPAGVHVLVWDHGYRVEVLASEVHPTGDAR